MNTTLKFFSKCGALTLAIILILTGLYVSLEPTLIQAATASDSVIVTLNVTSEISITSPADTSMSTNLGVSSDTAVGTTTWNVKTNNTGGYTLGVKASTDPAMQTGGGDTIEDYTTTGPSLWSVSSGDAAFGFSGFGTDVSTAAWGTGSACSGAATSTVSTTLKYEGFSTSDLTLASRSATTSPSGVDTTVCYAVEQNDFFIPSGTYTATITATATTQ